MVGAAHYGRIPEWPKGTDCKSAGDAFEGSNPSPSIAYSMHVYAISSINENIRADYYMNNKSPAWRNWQTHRT